MPFRIIRNDITKVKADAIVNTANVNVAIGTGVETAIYNAAGKEQLLEARKKIGTLEIGNVGITDAFNLDAKYIIHVSGPIWIDGCHFEGDILSKCYQKALQLAVDHDCKSIAFPLLATGNFGFPKEIGIQIAINAFTSFLLNNDIDITLVVFGDKDTKISGKLVEKVASFIDDQYVEEALEKEYHHSFFGSIINKSIAVTSGFLEDLEDEEEIQEFGSPKVVDEDELELALKDIYHDSFEKHLQALINKKGLKNAEVYTSANLSKQYFSKLLKGKVKPSKEKVLALAIGLHLNLDETIDFLKIAGYALSPISQTDKVVEYFILHEDYSVMKIDTVLYDFGLDMLSCS